MFEDNEAFLQPDPEFPYWVPRYLSSSVTMFGLCSRMARNHQPIKPRLRRCS